MRGGLVCCLLGLSLAGAQPSLQLLSGHRAPVGAVAFGPDGVLALGADAYIQLYRSDGRLERTLSGHTDTVYALDFSSTGLLLSASADTTLWLWDARSGEVRGSLRGHRQPVWTARFSPDGQLVLSGAGDGELRLWSLRGGSRSLQMGRGWVYGVGFSPDGGRAAGGGQDGVVLWNLTGGRPFPLLAGSSVRALAWGPQGLITGDREGQVQFWSEEGGFVRQASAHRLAVSALVWGPDGPVSGGQEGRILRWKDGRPQNGWETAPVLSLALRERWLLSGHDDGRARLWSLDGGLVRVLEPPAASVAALAFSPDGRLLASGGWDGEVWLWEQGRPIHRFNEASLEVAALAFSPDGGYLAAGGRDGLTRIYHLGEKRLLRALEAHDNGVSALAFSPDGQRLATGGRDRLVRVWDWRSGRRGLEFRAHESHVTGLAFTLKGRGLVSASSDESLAWWLLEPDGVRLLRRVSHSGSVYSLAQSPDGQVLATGGRDPRVRIWDGRTGALLAVLEGHLEAVGALAFSPDGKRLASVGWDKALRVWNLEGRTLFSLSGFVRPLYAVAWSPKGDLAVGAGRLGQGGTIGLLRPR
ncbi:MAG: WD40 repeat domain-containing protein [Meiothermus sp.]|uniref:WD40 repeat domain-containing protein n=1 Tax=Meiothermus sp. TaxID=1955249 RepID=UPI002600F248|nr:WD40 repeat domain-containing protein [Meiothermus sp.]MCS7059285.1 WD40 repeat domain-containing protein [Meiothermus sp.]MCS7195172.1 WD40 repeat domain-containing protein [Meiothermus sp.]MCX7740961.1 WD40 repeat domain-containing protein [Meiothermus sp.]MDW8482105.1 WD40 repeat domain-containing protein [Meiothermus sp.]